MALDIVVDSNVLSYPVLVFMKDQDAVVGRGGASPQSSGEVEPVLGRRSPPFRRRVRRSYPLALGQGGARPRTSGEAEPSPWGSGKTESSP